MGYLMVQGWNERGRVQVLTIGLFLAISFLVSLAGLTALIWAVSTDQFSFGQKQARIIFIEGEEGHLDDPTAGSGSRDLERASIDRTTAWPVSLFLGAAVVWLVIGSFFGLIASLKLHLPDWLDENAVLTFGRMRTLHLTMVIYGWLSLGGIGTATWITPRIFHSPLRSPRFATWGAIIWNAGLIAGCVAIATGWTDGEEWLEIPWQIDGLLALGGGLAVVPVLRTAFGRSVDHIYVSGWYFLAALCWFPALFIIANIPGLFVGAEQATVNWWFAHNVLGLWLTPLGLGAAYYFIPKIIGKPVYSYSLSLIGFWALALFYSQVGIHHLIGGPVPTWVVTLSVVQSVMMVVPVLAVAINQHVVVASNLWAFRASLPLRFISLGAMMYTLASVEGSLEALRSINTVTHFTQFTIAHAHLGAYGFASFILFGSIYYMMPRITGRAWPWPGLITVHFWSVLAGFAVYFVALTIGGLLQGEAMLDAGRPFAQSVILLKPYLEARSIGGAVMTLGHILLAVNVAGILARSAADARKGETA
jgi:cytochrome c oxidase cbb3-type subunit 1